MPGVDDDGQDHLLQVGAMVVRVAVSPQAVAASAIERQAGFVHEDQRQATEQITAALEQAVLASDRLIDAAREFFGIRYAAPRIAKGFASRDTTLIEAMAVRF
jgi:hypothetical protein